MTPSKFWSRFAGAGTTPNCDAVKPRSPLEMTLSLITSAWSMGQFGPFTFPGSLERAAQRHSKSMDERNYFSHVGPGGSSPQSRIQSTGYMSGASAWGIAENIRWGRAGRGSPKAAVAAWMNSAAHRSALLSGRYEHVGVGVAIGSPTGGGENNTAIYTATFGYRSG